MHSYGEYQAGMLLEKCVQHWAREFLWFDPDLLWLKE